MKESLRNVARVVAIGGALSLPVSIASHETNTETTNGDVLKHQIASGMESANLLRAYGIETPVFPSPTPEPTDTIDDSPQSNDELLIGAGVLLLVAAAGLEIHRRANT